MFWGSMIKYACSCGFIICSTASKITYSSFGWALNLIHSLCNTAYVRCHKYALYCRMMLSRCICSKTHNDGKADSTAQLSPMPFAGYLISGRSLTLPGRSSPTDSSTSSQSVSLQLSSTHSLSLPNLQQHCTDATSFINDVMNTEWVSLMTSMNLGEVGDVSDSTESRSVFQLLLSCVSCLCLCMERVPIF